MYIPTENENLFIDAIKAIQAQDVTGAQVALKAIDGVIDINGARRILFYLMGTANEPAIEFFVNAMMTGAQETVRAGEVAGNLIKFLESLKKDEKGLD